MQHNSKDSDNQKNSIASDENADSTIAEPITDGGQRLALEERLDTGSKSWGDVKKDKGYVHHRPSFPACTSARTTLHSQDADDDRREQYDVFFLLQHGRQHPAERRVNGYSEGWDGQKVRTENVWKYYRAHIILSRAGVHDLVKEWAVKKVMTEELQGFSRYYQGIDGAALGFATLYKYDDEAMAKDSYLVDEAEEILSVDGKQLVDYVWREYGDDMR